ncbi:siroheme decarboxylase subunit beta [Bradyrhizobium sp. HKCCYLS20291]|uniref:siroheme decarboxylase subunit beta n=1 Tax=Bradyrhizobium sp. HKCCYLS20291 TaxID=3420766 RepID=UPI003EB92B10
MMPNPTELALIDRWQHNFPLVERPFEVVGRSAALNQTETIGIFRAMHAREVISRIGAVVRPNTLGASTLAAMQVPAERFEEVAALVSRQPLVTHNYERTHDLNLWFVLAGANADAVRSAMRSIAAQTGLAVLDLPMLRAYHLGLGFSLSREAPQSRSQSGAIGYAPAAADSMILAAIQDGLPLVETPYRAVAEALGLDEACVIGRLEHLIAAGVVTRFGCVVRHDKLGYRANAMAVWDVPDDMVDAVADVFARHPRVTLCYQRPRRLPLWRYNLFCMVHAKSRDEAYAVLDDLALQADTGLLPHDVLFSTRCFKQRGAVFAELKEAS